MEEEAIKFERALTRRARDLLFAARGKAEATGEGKRARSTFFYRENNVRAKKIGSHGPIYIYTYIYRIDEKRPSVVAAKVRRLGTAGNWRRL